MKSAALFLLMPCFLFAAEPDAAAAAKAALDAYAEAINKQNLDAIAATWAENAEHINDEGTVTQGRAKITELFKTIFANNPKLSVKIMATNARFLGDSVLLADGTAEVKTGDAADISRFESIWVKVGNAWQMSRVRELSNAPISSESNYEKLKELEWLVGEWTSESKGYGLAVNVKWTKNKNFLLVEQTVTADGKESVTVMKVIGWDPSRESLRSWVFDSDGGFGGGLFTRSGNSWTEASEALTRSGGEATATHTLKFVDQNTFEWSSTDRQLDSNPLPELKLTYTRKPAGK